MKRVTCLLCVLLAVTEVMAQEIVPFDLPKPSDRVVYRPHNPAAAFSIRNNVLYDATGTPNLGVEFGLGRNFSLGLAFGFKSWNRFLLWDTNDENPTKWRHMAIVPEFRWYPRSVSNGHYVGVDGLYLHYNVGALKLPFGLYPDIRDQRVQGDLFGAGLFYGYAFRLSARWRLEAELGLTGGWFKHQAYECETCGKPLGSRSGWTLLPKLGVNVVYSIEKKQ